MLGWQVEEQQEGQRDWNRIIVNRGEEQKSHRKRKVIMLNCINLG